MKMPRLQRRSRRRFRRSPQVIDQVARSLRDGGRLIYIGAGSSGRIAALDASECPPTYSTAPGQVQYIMAGGPKALASAVEVNEDSEELGQRDIARRRPTRKDIVVGAFRFRPHALCRRRGGLRPRPRSSHRRRHLQSRNSAGCGRRYRHRGRSRPRGRLRLHAHEGRHAPRRWS